MGRTAIQLELRPRTWGGKRPGAGRKPSGRKVGVPHRARPAHNGRHPAHITLRASQALPSLRTERLFPAIRHRLAQASRNGLRVLQFSVQRDHIHLLVEADNGARLLRGIAGLAIRVARAVNRALGRRGAVWSDRYHARAVTTPRAVRHAIVYVVMNRRKHCAREHGLDRCSSAPWFRGWRDGPVPASELCPVVRARTWLASVGWRRHGLVGLDEHPRTEVRPGSWSPRLRR